MEAEKQNIAYMGIDPGKSGFITIFIEGEFHFFSMPYHKVPTGALTKTGKPVTKDEFHEEGFRNLIFDIRKLTQNHILKTAIEEVGGRGGWSATNNFEFGYTAGMQKMIPIMLGSEYVMVRPQRWQSFMRRGYPDIKKPSSSGKTMVRDPKAVAEMIVEKEYPDIDFRKTQRAKKNDDNKIDSFLICLYLMRTDKK